MSRPALYRYFAGRDALLTELISLEIEGTFASIGVDANRLFDAEVAALQ